MSSEKKNAYLLIAVLALMWGSSFILMKRALLVYTPYQVGAFRIFIAFVFMFPFVIRHFGKVDKSLLKWSAATGILGNCIPAILFPLAETKIGGGVAGMLNTLTPIFTLIVGVLLFGMQVGRNRIYGLVIGLFGAVLMILGESGLQGIGTINAFALLVVLATVMYAFSVNILKSKLSTVDPIRNTGFALFFTGIPMGIYLFSTDFIHRTKTVDGSGFSLMCIAILGIAGTAASTILFNKLIKVSGALAAASVTYLIPIVAILWGLWDHEVFTIYHVIGMLAILMGVYMVNRRGRSVEG
jgi:drug/metabolite transporter (DMT)-like permease